MKSVAKSFRITEDSALYLITEIGAISSTVFVYGRKKYGIETVINAVGSVVGVRIIFTHTIYLIKRTIRTYGLRFGTGLLCASHVIYCFTEFTGKSRILKNK